MTEPAWSEPTRIRGIWFASELRLQGSERLRCRLAVSAKGEVDVLAGAPDYPGAAEAIAACLLAAQRHAVTSKPAWPPGLAGAGL